VSPRETLPYLDFISFSRSCGKSFKLVLKSPTKYHLLEKKTLLKAQQKPSSDGNFLIPDSLIFILLISMKNQQ
jgi:hypothetical protein